MNIFVLKVLWSLPMLSYDECQKRDEYYKIKQSTIQTINDYVELGYEPGGFVTAVLANDLKEAFGRADIQNRETMFQIVSYVYNEIPNMCQGSYEIVKNWLAKKWAVST